MPITEEQLKGWSQQGSTTAAQNTLESIRYTLLTEGRSLIRDMKVDFFMHGSYQNGTNIGDKDPVDAAVVLTSAWSQDIAMTGRSQQALFQLMNTWQNFRLDILGSLRAKYGLVNVEDQPNCLRVEGSADRLPVNIAVGLQHRLYFSFNASSGRQYQEGMTFWTPQSLQVENFPKVHFENGQAKDGEAGTKGWFKPVVRMFKNARSFMVARDIIDAAIAPSYFIECLAYNAPNQNFGRSCQDSFAGVLKWLATAPLAGLKVQNGIDPLFGSGPTQWSDKHARIFIDTLVRVWNEWDRLSPTR
jgi:hypothetical protein